MKYGFLIILLGSLGWNLVLLIQDVWINQPDARRGHLGPVVLLLILLISHVSYYFKKREKLGFRIKTGAWFLLVVLTLIYVFRIWPK